MYADASSSMMMLRSDVDVDPIASNGYPRTETRELAQDGTTLRAFNPTTGDHWVECWVFPTHLPPTYKPSFVMIQMHDNANDLIEIAWQPASTFATDGKQEIVLRINGTSSGVPTKFNTNAQLHTWYRCRIHVGAIISGAAGYECTVNNVTMLSSDSGMPALVASGANSYFKCGMYLQTKWTGSGTGGLETDRNEYGEAGYRDFRTSHNGETATSVQVRGTDNPDTISNVAWGAKTSGHQTVALAGISLTPALPSGLTDGDMMFCIIRSSRGINSTSTVGTSTVPSPNTAPSSPSIATLWTKAISTHTPALSSGTELGAYPGGPQLAFHTCRWMLWVKPWVSGDVAPTVTYAAGSTLTDTMTAQIFKCSGAKWSSVITEFLDQEPNGLDLTNPADNTNTVTGIAYSSSTSTTALGPTAALASNCVAGALAIACVYHETNATSTTVGTVTGGSDGLTWAAGGTTTTTTVTPASGTGAEADEPAFAHDWAIVPTTAGQAIPAKSASATISNDANKPNTSSTVAGKGWGLLFTIAPARKHRRWLRAAS